MLELFCECFVAIGESKNVGLEIGATNWLVPEKGIL